MSIALKYTFNKKKIKFIYNEVFDDPKKIKHLIKCPKIKNVSQFYHHSDELGSMFKSNTLSKEDLKKYFIKMNYFKYRCLSCVYKNNEKKAIYYLDKFIVIAKFIANSNVRLAVSTSSKLASKYNKSKGEFLSTANLVLMKVIESFDPFKDFCISSYLCKSIISAINRERGNRYNLEISIDNSIDTIDESEWNNQEQKELTLYRKELINSAFVCLNEREIDIITCRFNLNGKGIKTLKELGNKYNVESERIRQIQSRAITKMMKHLKSKNLEEFALRLVA